MKALDRLVACLLLPALAGCYTYTVVTPDRVKPGQDVRARLRAEASDQLTQLLGADASLLEGELIAHEENELVLFVPAATRQVGFHSETLKQRVRVPESSVLLLERRQLDRTRTTLMAAAVGLGVGAIAWNALSGQAGANTATGPGDGNAQRVRQLTLGLVIFRFSP